MFIRVIYGTWIEIFEPTRGVRLSFPHTKGDLHKSTYRDPAKLLKRLRRSKVYMIDHFSETLFYAHLENTKFLSQDLKVSEDFLYELTDGMNIRNNNELSGLRRGSRKTG